MVFSTAIFLTLFLPLVLLGCWALAGLCHAVARRTGSEMAWRPVNALILLASLLFYFWGEGLGVAWLVASVLFNAGCARVLARRESPRWRQGWLAAAVAGVALAYPVVPWLRAALGRRLAEAPRSGTALRLAVYAGECALLTALGLLSLLFVAGGSYNPFLYFRF